MQGQWVKFSASADRILLYKRDLRIDSACSSESGSGFYQGSCKFEGPEKVKSESVLRTLARTSLKVCQMRGTYGTARIRCDSASLNGGIPFNSANALERLFAHFWYLQDCIHRQIDLCLKCTPPYPFGLGMLCDNTKIVGLPEMVMPRA